MGEVLVFWDMFSWVLVCFFVFVSGMIGCDGSYWKSEKRAGRWVLDVLGLYDVEPGYDRIW